MKLPTTVLLCYLVGHKWSRVYKQDGIGPLGPEVQTMRKQLKFCPRCGTPNPEVHGVFGLTQLLDRFNSQK